MADDTNEQVGADSAATLFHDIATPLVVAKMKAELLARYLPDLVRAVANSPEMSHLLPTDEKLIEALVHSPEIMASNLAIVQKKINVLSASMQYQFGNFSIKTSADDAAVRVPDGNTSIFAGAPVRSVPIKTVLLVDDEAIHRDIAESLLTPHYSVDYAKNGLEAINMCESKEYDLILMDLHMPKMNGEQATIALRGIISNETIIVGLTSLPIGANRSGLIARGFNDFLEKPLTFAGLQNLLRNYSRNA